MWSKLKYYFSKFIIKFFGDIQFFPAPLFCLLWGDTHYHVKAEELRVIFKILKKGDILLVRTNRYVSSWFIPGFYTHVALSLGDNIIIEAVTDGVQLNDILSLGRCDYVCILRPKNISRKNINNACVLANNFLGCKYDFVFSNDTDEYLYCSELVYKAYEKHFTKLGQDGVIAPDEYRNQELLEEIHESRKWREKT